jgi:hypothetical protein
VNPVHNNSTCEVPWSGVQLDASVLGHLMNPSSPSSSPVSYWGGAPELLHSVASASAVALDHLDSFTCAPAFWQQLPGSSDAGVVASLLASGAHLAALEVEAGMKLPCAVWVRGASAW